MVGGNRYLEIRTHALTHSRTHSLSLTHSVLIQMSRLLIEASAAAVESAEKMKS